MLAESITTVNQVVAESSSEIHTLVQAGGEKVENGIQVTEHCKEFLERVTSNVKSVVKMMTEVSVAAREQSEGVSNISQAMGDMSRTINESSDIALETTKNADQLLRQADQLTASVYKLETEIEGKAGGSSRHRRGPMRKDKRVS